MCGRFTLKTSTKQLATMFDGLKFGDSQPRYNICPTQPVLGIRLNAEESRCESVNFRWGLIPSWAKQITIGAKMINARCETIADKPAFRNAFKLGSTARGRCLILADGFYEWKNLGGSKQPFYISLKCEQPFAMAGLWECWADPERRSGTIESCTIMTQPATPFMQDLHDRMPAILSAEAGMEWLKTDLDGSKLIDWLNVVNHNVDLQAWPVSDRVNKPVNDSPELIHPVEGRGSQGLLF